MGEIKSTWELVLEKLKGMEVTDEEKERFQRKEDLEKAKRLFFPYFEGNERDWDRFKEEVRRLNESAFGEFLRLISENLSFETGLTERQKRALEALFGKDSLLKIEELIERFKKRQEVEVEALKAELLQAFERKGIRGSAIDPNPRLHPRWPLVVDQVKREFQKELLSYLEGMPLT